MKHALGVIVQEVEKKRHLAAAALSRISCMNSHDGGISFDNKTKTKTVKSLLGLFDWKGAGEFVKKHVSVLKEEGEKRPVVVVQDVKLIKAILQAIINVSVFQTFQSLLFRFSHLVRHSLFRHSLQASRRRL